jgi:hypothetical protein
MGCRLEMRRSASVGMANRLPNNQRKHLQQEAAREDQGMDHRGMDHSVRVDAIPHPSAKNAEGWGTRE